MYRNFLKRLLDVFLGMLLLPLIAFVMLVIALLIKFDSSGPVFFLQRRVGYKGRYFNILKFRTMHIGSAKEIGHLVFGDISYKDEIELYGKVKNDPRRTRVGCFLREWSLDELPQIVNILKGDMSFVGPRPVVRQEIDSYYKDEAVYYFSVRPGVTGLWQVSGRNRLTYGQRVLLDRKYVLEHSFLFDINILARTFNVIIKKEGAA